jgi:hypothetical protein
MPWKTVRLGWSCFALMLNSSMVWRYRMLMLLPPSIRTQLKRQVRLSVENVDSSTRAYAPGEGIRTGWSAWLQVMGLSDQCMKVKTSELTAFTSRCCYRLLCLSLASLVKTT